MTRRAATNLNSNCYRTSTRLTRFSRDTRSRTLLASTCMDHWMPPCIPMSTVQSRRFERCPCPRVGGIVIRNDTCVKWLAKLTGRDVSNLRASEVKYALQEVACRIQRYGLALRSVGVEFNTLAMLMTQSVRSNLRIFPNENYFMPTSNSSNLEREKQRGSYASIWQR